MSRSVLDASATLAWLLADEVDDAARAIIDELILKGAVATGHWPLEVANGLVVAERRSRISGTERRNALQKLTGLGVELDQRTAQQAWTSAVDLAIAYRLTVYDAAYLELALRLGLPLATRDAALAIAARQAGVSVLD